MEYEIYEKLRQVLDKMPFGMPKSGKGLEIRILRRLFSPEEARIVLYLNMLPEQAQAIYKRMVKDHFNISIGRLEEQLEEMSRKGLIFKNEKTGKRYYSIAMFVVGIFEFQVDRMSIDFYQDCEEYLNDVFAGEFFRNNMPQLRTVPIGASIPPDKEIALYDNVRKTVERIEGGYVLVNCICRQGRDLIGESCKRTDLRETCLIFPNAAHSYINMGIGRKISQQEAVAVLQRAEDAGLVLQMGNAQKNPLVVCCCCDDCCAVLSMAKKFPRPADIVSSNYYAEINKDACIVCKKCSSRCHMQAIETAGEIQKVNLARCIGCGVCVPTCPETAISLLPKKKKYTPPKTAADYYKKILLNKINLWGIIKIAIKMIFRQKILMFFIPIIIPPALFR